MLRRATLFAAVAAVLLAAPGLAQPPAPREPLVREGATQRLTDHVWAIPDNSVPGVPNVGFVVGKAGVLVIDTGMGPPNGRTVLAEARKLSPTGKLYLVTTHVHPEHDLGAQAFPADTVMIRAKAQVAEIAAEGMRTADLFRSRSTVNARLLDGAAFRPATLTFDTSHTLDLGGVKVRLVAVGPNHTPGDTAIWVEGEGVLFSGDVAMRALPAFASGKSSVAAWLKSLDAFDALKPKVVVPSHGPIGDAGYIAGYRSYLKRVQARTAALKAEGKTAEQATETLTAELKPDYPDLSRLPGAVRAAWAEAR